MDYLSQLAVIVLLSVLLSGYRGCKKSQQPLPPGPPAEFLLGHARIFPREQPQLRLAEWAKQYGDIMHFNILGKSLIVLSSQFVTNELLEKRGSLYSSRPRFRIFELAGWAAQHAFMPYGKKYIQSQKWWQSGLGARQAATYRPVQLNHARTLVRNLATSPENLSTHVARFAVSVVVEVVYGPETATDKKIDRIIYLQEDITGKLAAMGETSFLDLLPFLIYLPSWLPGLKCLAIARETWGVQQELEYVPFEELRQKVATGQAYRALLASSMEKSKLEGRLTEDELTSLRLNATAALGAGSETTWSMIMNFIAAMLLFPDVQKKAHEEMNRVIGRDRLPDFSDRESLPYIQGLMYETMRWHPAVPLAIPHLNTQDDVYNGMAIPKGSIILANAVAMANDEKIYHQPEKFSPERFSAGRNEPVPTNIAFGHGRRICPGRHLADSSVWIVIASLLSAFEIRPILDLKGQDVKPDIKFTTAITSHPEPFQCRFIPRNPGPVKSMESL